MCRTVSPSAHSDMRVRTRKREREREREKRRKPLIWQCPGGAGELVWVEASTCDIPVGLGMGGTGFKI